ncbi:hypothetical protein GCM10011519_30650 [Marmoricola endophyticus]|uniref:DinB-like domain-containing protein n=1 Tax=Marmoricola endophyticus TaxID=2040280 RepID=A0A917F7H6_9ACTN|nr:DinB family protein [Marmoricola endophyticus]GGF54624.1 hypothetical protein GCM10011519_30650 [Marmoricola endophyticus]
MAALDWNTLLVDQLDWQWTHQTRPRLEGLSDEEYLWEPVPGWSLRPRGRAATSVAAGSGAWCLDWEMPDSTPDPSPVTTIAWRLGHVIVGVLAMRSANHFGAPATDYDSWEYAPTAAGGLAQLDEQYATWLAGVRSLGQDGLAEPCGPAEGPYAEEPMATLVLHIHRECLHHLAEVCLMRDLWANGYSGPT